MNPIDRFRRRRGPSPEDKRLGALLEKADAARDACDFDAAANGYRAFLKDRPEAAGIHVQLGHMLKESGNHTEAEACYRTALNLEPDNADTALMLGHLYKRWARYDAAEEFYKKALTIDPADTWAFRELSALGAFPARLLADQAKDAAENDTDRGHGGAAQGAKILLDLSDVFKFLKDNSTVSGIQRVQLAMTEALLESGRADLTVSYLDEVTRAYYCVPAGPILELCRVLKAHEAGPGRLKALIHEAEQAARPYAPKAGDTIFVAGAFWMLPDVHGLYQWLKSAGVRIGVYIYDIIPVTHPEFCARGLVSRFTRCLFHFLHLADFVFTISDYSGAELKRVFAPKVAGLAPVSTLSLAHEMPAAPRRDQVSARIARLLDEEYVLFVSTIEARKNHMYLFRAWQMLAARHPDRRLPKLVFVGKKGWRVDDLMESFKDTDYLGGDLKVLTGIGDADLALLYRHAKFTCFPSIVEGWGLPIGESLTYGTPCVASNTSSMPEVGGDMVDYIDPFNITGGVALFEELLFDENALAQRRQRIKETFTPVTWRAVADNLLSDIDQHRERLNKNINSRDPAHVFKLPPAATMNFEDSLEEAHLDRVRMLAAADFAFDERWFWDNDGIKWLIGDEAHFDLTLDAGPDGAPAAAKADDGTPVEVPVFLELKGSRSLTDGCVAAFHAKAERLGAVRLSADAGIALSFTVPMDTDTNRVSFRLKIEGTLPRDSRLLPLSIAVARLGTGTPGPDRFFTHTLVIGATTTGA